MLLTCILSVHHNSHWCTKTFATKDFFLKNTKATDIDKSTLWRKKRMKCAIYKVFWVSTVHQARFFCIYVFINFYPELTKEFLTFTMRTFFLQEEKKLNNIYHGVRCQQQRSLKLRTKFTMDTYLVRSAQHNWQFLNRTLVLALGNIAEGVM